MASGMTWRKSLAGLGAACALGGLSACVYNEDLGRSQFLLGGGEQMAAAANDAWQQLKQQQKISTDRRYTERLNRVAPRVIRAAGGDPSQWEYLVFEDQSLNAFALPGGKIGIHTGIMDIMENDAQLAAVVGHEIAHVNYNHSAERYSQNMVAQVGLVGAQIGLGTRCGGATSAREREACQQSSARAAQALGAGAIYGLILPYSRKHELEADAGGVRYMARAGYDAQEALDFWQNMATASANQQRPPEFASTHPATETRIAALQEEIQQIRGQTQAGLAVPLPAQPAPAAYTPPAGQGGVQGRPAGTN